jgi:hypothetical protein
VATLKIAEKNERWKLDAIAGEIIDPSDERGFY